MVDRKEDTFPSPSRVHICILKDYPLQYQANARLIAAAPELLEALEYIAGCPQLAEVSDGEFLSEIREKARQAIAKAKGE